MNAYVAVADLINAACDFRDHDWQKEDPGKVMESLDSAVDELRRCVREIGQDERKGPRLQSMLRHIEKLKVAK